MSMNSEAIYLFYVDNGLVVNGSFYDFNFKYWTVSEFLNMQVFDTEQKATLCDCKERNVIRTIM